MFGETGEKWFFAARHYLPLLLVALACWGLGRAALAPALRQIRNERWLALGMALSAGLGIAILVLQVLGAVGALNAACSWALLIAGLLCAAWQLGQAGSTSREALARLRNVHWTAWVVIALAIRTTVYPLRQPLDWDELAYHLPHAQQWALSGGLQVNEWLRYPWFPYNFHLLFAGALVLFDDVFAHLLHALSGWVTVLLVYQFGKRYASREVACLACVILLLFTVGEYSTAYVDLGVTLFVVSAGIAFQLWRESGSSRTWLAAAAFLLGVAAGSKYQALMFLPLFGVAVLARDRRASTIAIACGAFGLPCIYWYARNALMTGDPFDPIGGTVFGFSDWNLGDYQYQLEDVKSARGWPEPWLWPSALAVLLPSVWRNAGMRAALLFALYAVIGWGLTSHYPRYLLPAYPLLALFAAAVYLWLPVRAWRFVQARLTASRWDRAVAVTAKAVLVGVLAIATVTGLDRDLKQVAATAQQRNDVLQSRLREYAPTLAFLHSLPGARIYQNGMEAVLYYAPHPIYGDHFGPYRYRDYVNLPPGELAAKLRAAGLDTLVLRVPFNTRLIADAQFASEFVLLHSTPTFNVYRVGR